MRTEFCKRPLERPRRKCEDNTKMDHRKFMYEDREIDRSSSDSCSVVDFDIRGVESSSLTAIG
jgi:hypothetical protein